MKVKFKPTLKDVFGIWKDKGISLEKIREKQWGKRKLFRKLKSHSLENRPTVVGIKSVSKSLKKKKR